MGSMQTSGPGALPKDQAAMFDGRDIDREIGRVVASLLGLALLALVGRRIWYWWAGMSDYKTFLGAVAGRPFVCGLHGRGSWDYGLWELCPDGQLAGVVMIVFVLTVLGGAIFNSRSLLLVGGCVILGGYLVNACLFLKLMAAY